MKPVSQALLSLLLCAGAAFAQYDGGSAGMFMNYGGSPRTLAMGKAFTGLADDVEAGYFNPAGLVQMNSQNVRLAHSMLLESQMEYIGYAMPTRAYGTFGLTLLTFWSSGLDSRDAQNNPYQTSFFAENAFSFSYAYSPVRWFGAGANLKVVAKNLAEYSGLGVGADLGVIFLAPRPLQFGIFAQNLLAPRINLHSRVDQYPLTVRVGVATKLYHDRVAIAFDMVKVGHWDRDGIKDYTVTPHGGLEFEIIPDVLTPRIGVDMNEVSVGLGLKKVWGGASLGVDYAFLLHYQSNYMVGPTHKLGLNIEFAGYRTWIQAAPSTFAPVPDDKKNVLWMDVKVSSRRAIRRWQILVKNSLGEVVRSFSGWENPPLRLAWDGLDDAGRLVSDGKYFYEIVLVDAHNESMDNGGALTTIKTRGPQGRIEVQQKNIK